MIVRSAPQVGQGEVGPRYLAVSLAALFDTLGFPGILLAINFLSQLTQIALAGSFSNRHFLHCTISLTSAFFFYFSASSSLSDGKRGVSQCSQYSLVRALARLQSLLGHYTIATSFSFFLFSSYIYFAVFFLGLSHFNRF